MEIRGTCHQYDIRQQKETEHPHEKMTLEELNQCEVQQITRKQAEEIILEYEWLGTVRPGSIAFYGLITPTGEIAGVAIFGRTGGPEASRLCGEEYSKQAICLERGTCLPWTHKHAPSYFIPRACKKASEDYGWVIFYGYSDISAGEIGQIYQSCNWIFTGFGAGRNRPKGGIGYRWEFYHKPTDTTYTSKQIRAKKKRAPENEKHLWEAPYLRTLPDWEARKSYDKGRYVYFVGDKRLVKKLKKSLRYPEEPYPKKIVVDK